MSCVSKKNLPILGGQHGSKTIIRGEISIRTHFLISTCANISETGFSGIQTVSSTGDLENVLAETWESLAVVRDACTLG